MSNLSRQNAKLTKISDHIQLPFGLDGFGETITPYVNMTDGDLVPTTAANAFTFIGITAFCALTSGPLAIATVPLSALAGLVITLNDFSVCQKYRAQLDSVEPIEAPMDSCGECKYFNVNICAKWDDATTANSHCDDFVFGQYVAARKPTEFRKAQAPSISSTIATPQPQPIAQPMAALPVRSVMIDRDEELAIAAAKLKATPKQAPLSALAESAHESLMAELKRAPQGWSNEVSSLAVQLGRSEDELRVIFRELATKRREHYSLQEIPSFVLTTRGVA